METNLKKNLQNLTTELLKMANLYCWNSISKNTVFILSNISEIKEENFKKNYTNS